VPFLFDPNRIQTSFLNPQYLSEDSIATNLNFLKAEVILPSREEISSLEGSINS